MRTAVAAADDLGIRIQLIRRPGRRRAAAAAGRRSDQVDAVGGEPPPRARGEARQAPTAGPGLPARQERGDQDWPPGPIPVPIGIYAGWSAGPRPWLARRTVAEPGDVAALDLTGLAHGRPGEYGDPVQGPLLLVCTHGRRNVCCARLGRPLAATLAMRHGAEVWETTHVGGDRHAANLVILPHGLYYGPVDGPAANAAIGAYRRGEVVLDRFRGRAGQAEAAQAAEYRIRQRTGFRGIDDAPADAAGRGGQAS